jgi:hypothetical protein
MKRPRSPTDQSSSDEDSDEQPTTVSMALDEGSEDDVMSEDGPSENTQEQLHKYILRNRHTKHVEEEEEVIALRYLDGINVQAGYFGVWWNNDKNTYTEEPWAHLISFGEEFLQELRDVRPGQKVMMTGKRRRSVNSFIEPTGVLHQDRNGYCALNAVLNLVTLPVELVRAIRQKGPQYSHTAMSRQITRCAGCPVKMEKVKGQLDKIAFLRQQTQGLFVVYFQGHCLSWNANESLISDTDPGFPEPLTITDSNIALLMIHRIELVYAIIVKSSRS